MFKTLKPVVRALQHAQQMQAHGPEHLAEKHLEDVLDGIAPPGSRQRQKLIYRALTETPNLDTRLEAYLQRKLPPKLQEAYENRTSFKELGRRMFQPQPMMSGVVEKFVLGDFAIDLGFLLDAMTEASGEFGYREWAWSADAARAVAEFAQPNSGPCFCLELERQKTGLIRARLTRAPDPNHGRQSGVVPRESFLLAEARAESIETMAEKISSWPALIRLEAEATQENRSSNGARSPHPHT